MKDVHFLTINFFKCTILLHILFYICFYHSAFADDLKKMAKEGVPTAQFDLALREMSTNNNLISEWLVIAALQGHKKAGHYLAKLPSKPNSIANNLSLSNSNDISFLQQFGPIKKLSKEDLKTIRVKGNNGDIEAQYLMWELYVNDKGVSKAEAWTWLKQAAGNNHAKANFSLGLLYFYGYIVPEERKKATRLFKVSGELGFLFALNFLEKNNVKEN